MNNKYRDYYKNKFEDYLLDFLPTIDRKPSQAHQMAIDVFYLERNCPEVDFMYWFQSEQTFKEAEAELDRLFKNRKSYKQSLKDHIEYMTWFKQFLSSQKQS